MALLSQVQYLLSSDEKLKPRGEDYPFLIVNDTGLDLTVWTNGNKAETKTKVKYGQSKPWAFEDWRKIRENLDVNTANTLDVAFDNGSMRILNIYQLLKRGRFACFVSCS